MKKSIIIVGGGAAGYFSAINIAEKHPNYEVIILEKTNKYLGKVRISGGGRCNVTNERSNPGELVNFYPRGNKKLYAAFKSFSTSDMTMWLEQRGVATHAESDHRVFPKSNTSQTIIDCFVNEAYRLGIKIIFNSPVKAIDKRENYWVVATSKDELEADAVVFATGSSASSLQLLSNIGLKQSQLAPSLFTFNINDPRFEDLQGVSFPEVTLKVTKTKLEDAGPLLITHWGLSGPAILKLSAWGALVLKACDYRFELLINFVPEKSQNEVRQLIGEQKQLHPKRKVINYPLFGIPKRFWERICGLCDISNDWQNDQLSKKQINKLTEEFTQGRYQVDGKSTFKEEFVTCGGIELEEINLTTFECRRFPGLYLAGEVLNIDALTGGFNFQACWTAGWIISENIS